MTGNYPPGVTGNEPQIAGRPEQEETRKCDAHNIQRATMSWNSANAIQTLRGDLARMTNLVRRVTNGEAVTAADLITLADQNYGRLNQALVAGLEYFELDSCPFESEVKVAMEYGNFYWTCPFCGTEHEEEDTRAEDAAIELGDAMRKGEM